MIFRVSACLLLGTLIGCGGRGLESNVRGTVTYNDRPLTTGAVTFQSEMSGPLAVGDIQPDGTYVVQTGTEAGLKPGEYRVTVVATGPMPQATPQNPEPLPKLLIPAKYGDPTTSGLKYTVSAGDNRIDIVLGSESSK